MEKPDNDGVLKGIGLGCLSQLAALILAFVLLVLASNSLRGRQSWLLLCSWGLTQWLALVPLILDQRVKGHPGTVQGLLIAGGIGLLLSSACASVIFR